jgi:hypothetical protein
VTPGGHEPIVGQADAERELALPTDQLLKTMVFRADDSTVLADLSCKPGC